MSDDDTGEPPDFEIVEDEKKQLIPMMWTSSIDTTEGVVKKSENWFQLMSIATVVWHKGSLYKLRMPSAKDKIKYNLDITLPKNSAQTMNEGKYVPVKDGKIGEYERIVNKDGEEQYRKSTDEENAKYNYIRPKPKKNTFGYVVPNILSYKNINVQQPGFKAIYNNDEVKKEDADAGRVIDTRLDNEVLNPGYDVKKSKPRDSYNMKNGKKSTQDITLKCFAFDLNNSAHFFVYIAGEWFITISNPFKFFAEDMRTVDIDRIASKLKSIDTDTTNKIRFYVARENVDDLLLEIYPPWKNYYESRRDYISFGTSFFDLEEIWTIIYNHMHGLSITGNYSSAYPDKKEREEAAKKIRKNLENCYYKYVSLRPVWNTKERFDNFFAGLDGYTPKRNKTIMELLSPEEIRNKLPTKSSEREEEPKDVGVIDFLGAFSAKKAEPTEDSSPTPETTEYVYEGLSYDKIRKMMGDQWDKAFEHLSTIPLEAEATFPKIMDRTKTSDSILQTFIKKHITCVLDELKILKEDYNDIYKRLYKEDILHKNISIADLQESMINRANAMPGKFDLFKNLVLGTGIQTADNDPEKELQRVQGVLKAKREELDALFVRKARLTERADEGALDGQEQLLLSTIEQTIEKNVLANEIRLLTRELHVLKDPNWVLLKDILAKAGVKAENKKAVKTNLVYRLDEFGALLDRFTKEPYTISHKDMLKSYTDKIEQLKNLEDDPEEAQKINDRIKELKQLIDETHTSFGKPDKEPDNFQKLVHKQNHDGKIHERRVEATPINKLDSSGLFRGDKGVKLDAFIKTHLSKYPTFAKFKWYEGRDRVYGLTTHPNCSANGRKWMENNKEDLDAGRLKYDANMNEGEEGYIQLHIHKSREMPIEYTKLVLLHELAHAKVGFLPSYFRYVKLNRINGNLSLKNGFLQKSNRTPEDAWFIRNKAVISHNSIWQAAADELFYDNFEDIFGREFIPGQDDWLKPTQYNAYYTWGSVRWVKRYKNAYTPKGTLKTAKWAQNYSVQTRTHWITDVFYSDEQKDSWRERNTLRRYFEIVEYNPDDYGDEHYTYIDTFETRKRQKESHTAILKEISTLQAQLLNNNTSKRHSLQQEIKKIMKQLLNRDFQVFVQFAEYLRQKISTKTVFQDMANLYSAETLQTFKKDFGSILNTVEQNFAQLQKDLHTLQTKKIKGKLQKIPNELINIPQEVLAWKSQWFEVSKSDPNVKIIRKTFKDYMEAFISICYTTDGSTPETFKAKTGTDRTNAIPLALRYAMIRNKVHPTKININTIEKMKKFQLKDGSYNAGFLFAQERTRQQGIYDNTGVTMDKPTNEEGYKEFHEKATDILENWKPDRPYAEEQVPKTKKKGKEKSISRPLKSGKMPRRKSRGRKNNMDKYLDILGLEKVDVPKDGNCFFHALRLTAKLSDSHEELRTAIVIKLDEIKDARFYNNDPDFTIKNIMYRDQSSGLLSVVNSTQGRRTFDTVGGYLNAMIEDRSWADPAVVTAAMVYLNRPIFIVNDKSNTDHGFLMYQFPESLKGDRLGDPIVLTLNDGDRGGGNHYQATKIKPGGDEGETIDKIKEQPKTKALPNIQAIIKRASTMEPDSVKQQKGLTCGMHAINNLLGAVYTAEDLQAVCKDNKKDNWNQEVIMSFLGVKYGKNDSQSLTMQFDAASVKEMRTMTQFLSFDGLLGFVLHSPGHWTAMRRWDTSVESGFSYMDSLPRQERNRLRTFKTAEEMADYLLSRVINKAKIGDDIYVIYPVFLSPKQKQAFDASGIPKLGKKPLPGSDRLDLTNDEPDEKHELIIFYANHLISLGATITLKGVQKRGKLYKVLGEKIIADLKTIAEIVKREAGLEQPIDELITFALGAPLEQKKTWIKLYVNKL